MHVPAVDQSDDVDGSFAWSIVVHASKMNQRKKGLEWLSVCLYTYRPIIRSSKKKKGHSQEKNGKKNLRVLLLFLDDIANLEIQCQVRLVARSVACPL